MKLELCWLIYFQYIGYDNSKHHENGHQESAGYMNKKCSIRQIDDMHDHEFEFPLMLQRKDNTITLNEKWKHLGNLT